MKLSRSRAAASAVLLSILALALITRASRRPDYLIDETRFLMGTIVQIKLPAADGQNREDLKRAAADAFREIERVESAFSIYKPDSEISRINRIVKGEKVLLSPEVFRLIRNSIKYSELTNGAFDITIKPLKDLWTEYGRQGRLPSQNEFDLAMSRVGYKSISLDETSGTISFLKEGMAIDLGGIAKGYAADTAIETLKRRGVRNAIVACAGDMYCLGERSNGVSWSVGIQHPRKKNEIILKLSLRDEAVNTSGDYERYSVIYGKRYSHIINPITGYPVGDDVVGATVISKNSETSDALATALCVLGVKGLDIVKSVKGASAIIMMTEGGKLKMRETAGFRDRYEKK